MKGRRRAKGVKRAATFQTEGQSSRVLPIYEGRPLGLSMTMLATLGPFALSMTMPIAAGRPDLSGPRGSPIHFAQFNNLQNEESPFILTK